MNLKAKQTKVIKIYQTDFEYVKKFYVPFENSIADAVEKALNLSRSTGRKGKANGRTIKTKKENAIGS